MECKYCGVETDMTVRRHLTKDHGSFPCCSDCAKDKDKVVFWIMKKEEK